MDENLGRLSFEGLPELNQQIQKLIAELQSLQKEFKQSENSSKLHSDTVKEQSKDVGFLQNKIVSLTASIVSAEAIYNTLVNTGRKVIEFFKDSTKAAIDEQVAENKLYNALGKNTSAYAEMVAFKEKMLKGTTFSKQEIEGAINMGLELGRTTDQTQKMLIAAEGLSKVTGKDLNSSMMMLSASLEGQSGRLGRYAGEIKSLTAEQLKSGEAIDIIAKKFGKFSTEGLDTASGSINQFEKAWETFQINVGNAFLPGLQSLYKGLTDIVNKVNEWIAIPLSESTKKEKEDINLLVGEITSLNKGNDLRKRLLDDLLNKYPEYFANIDKDKITNKELKEILDNVNASIEKKIHLMALDEKGIQLENQRTEAFTKANQSYKNLVEIYKEVAKHADIIPAENASLTEMLKTVEKFGDYKNIVQTSYGATTEGQSKLKEFKGLLVDYTSANKEYSNIGKDQVKNELDKQKALSDVEKQIQNDNKTFENADKATKTNMLNAAKKQKADIIKEYEEQRKLGHGEQMKQLYQDQKAVEDQVKNYQTILDQLNQATTKPKSVNKEVKSNELEEHLKQNKQIENADKAMYDQLIKDYEEYIKNETDPTKLEAGYNKLRATIQNSLDKQTDDRNNTYQKWLADLNTEEQEELKAVKGNAEKTKTIQDNYKEKRKTGELEYSNDLTKIYNDSKNSLIKIDDDETKQELDLRKDLYKKQQGLIDDNLTKENDYYSKIENIAKKSSVEKIKALEVEAEAKHKLLIQQINAEFDAEIALAKTQEEKDNLERARKQALDKENKNYQTSITNLTNAVNEQIKKSIDNINSLIANMGTPFTKIGEDLTKLFSDIINKTGDLKANITELAYDVAKTIENEIFGSLTKAVEKNLQNTLDSIDKATTKEQTNLDKLNQQKYISDAEYQRRKDKLEKDKENAITAAKKAAAEKEKKYAFEQAIINALLAGTMALATSGNPILGIVMAAIVTALGMATAAVIASKPLEYAKGGIVKRYDSGGILDGPSHSMGGIPLIAEGGEFITNRTQTQKFLPVLQAINDNKIQSSAPIVAAVDHQAVAMAVISAIKQIPVVVSEQDITKIQKKVSVYEQRSSW